MFSQVIFNAFQFSKHLLRATCECGGIRAVYHLVSALWGTKSWDEKVAYKIPLFHDSTLLPPVPWKP